MNGFLSSADIDGNNIVMNLNRGLTRPEAHLKMIAGADDSEAALRAFFSVNPLCLSFKPCESLGDHPGALRGHRNSRNIAFL